MNPPVSPDHREPSAEPASHPYRKPVEAKVLPRSAPTVLALDDNEIRTLHRLLVVEKYRLQNVPVVTIDVGTLQHIIELQDRVDAIYPHGEKIPE